MIDKFKRLLVAIVSLVVLVAGALGVLLVLGMVTASQLKANMSVLLQISAIVFIVAGVFILLLKITKK